MCVCVHIAFHFLAQKVLVRATGQRQWQHQRLTEKFRDFQAEALSVATQNRRALWEETLGCSMSALRRDAACSISVTFLCCVEEGLWAAVLKKESYCHGKLLREVRRERLCQGKRSTSSNWKFSHFLSIWVHLWKSYKVRGVNNRFHKPLFKDWLFFSVLQ